MDSNATKLTPTNISLSNSLPSSLHSDETGDLQRDESRDKYVSLDDNESISGTFRLDTCRTESRANLKTKSKQEEQQSYIKNVPKLPFSRQQGSSYQVQGFQSQWNSQGMNNLESYMEKSHPSFSVDVQPSLHAPPLYATAAAYMASGNPFYTNLQQSGLYAPQYGLTGYPLGSTLLPPLMAGYPSHPVPFSSPNFIGQTTSVPTGERIPHVGDVQHHYRQPQPPFVNPLHMQYYPRSAHEMYGSSVPHGQLASRGIMDSPFTQQESTFSAYMGDPKYMGISTPRKMGINGNGNSPFMGIMTQFPASPLASPIMPSSPVGGPNYLGRHTEMRFPQGTIRSPGQGKRGFNSADDQKKLSFLEELKSSNSPKLGLSDIQGHIIDLRHCSVLCLLLSTQCSCLTKS